jgi:hypothetical protein
MTVMRKAEKLPMNPMTLSKPGMSTAAVVHAAVTRVRLIALAANFRFSPFFHTSQSGEPGPV